MSDLVARPTQFFLRCDEEARYFYVVQIYPTRESMLRAIATLKGERIPSADDADTVAVCCRYQVVHPRKDKELRKLQKRHDQIGTIFFTRGEMPESAVVHELFHAAIGWARRVKLNPMRASKHYRKCPEEAVARVLQSFFEQFYAHSHEITQREAA